MSHFIIWLFQILAIIAILLLFTANAQWKTIIIEVDPVIVKIVYTINLIMTILISTLMMMGAMKVVLFSYFFVKISV